MTESEIRSQIYYYDRKINETFQWIKVQEDRMMELQMLITKLASLEDEFTGRKQEKQSLLDCLKNSASMLKVAQRYESGMTELVSGSNYRKAISAFENSVIAAKREMEVCDNKIMQAYQKINQYQSKIHSLENSLVELTVQE